MSISFPPHVLLMSSAYPRIYLSCPPYVHRISFACLVMSFACPPHVRFTQGDRGPAGLRAGLPEDTLLKVEILKVNFRLNGHLFGHSVNSYPIIDPVELG